MVRYLLLRLDLQLKGVLRWKLLMRPAHLPIIRDLELPPLPKNVTVDKIFADHLRYIKDQVKAYITTTYGSGGNIWDLLSPTMYVILTTPNGWEGAQQSRMRQAAITAGLVDEAGGRRVKFVTEAEVSMSHLNYIWLILFSGRRSVCRRLRKRRGLARCKWSVASAASVDDLYLLGRRPSNPLRLWWYVFWQTKRLLISVHPRGDCRHYVRHLHDLCLVCQ
jgi:hypothetical protein